jgi:hypothetical protein
MTKLRSGGKRAFAGGNQKRREHPVPSLRRLISLDPSAASGPKRKPAPSGEILVH